MIEDLFATPGFEDAVLAETPLGSVPDVEDVVNAVLWLASHDSRFVTGENIHIDGGMRTRRLPRADDFEAAYIAAVGQQ